MRFGSERIYSSKGEVKIAEFYGISVKCYRCDIFLVDNGCQYIKSDLPHLGVESNDSALGWPIRVAVRKTIWMSVY